MDSENIPMLNIDKLHSNQTEKLKRRYETYENILFKCHNRIKATSQVTDNLSCCFFTVPQYIYGIPLYDNKGCILYVVSSLLKNGFEVRYTHPNLLFISWMNKTNNNMLKIENKTEAPKKTQKSVNEYKPTNSLTYNKNILSNIDDKINKLF